MDDQTVDDAGEPVEREVETDRGIGGDVAFHGGVGDVAFMPQGDVFQRRMDASADQARQSRQIF